MRLSLAVLLAACLPIATLAQSERSDSGSDGRSLPPPVQSPDASVLEFDLGASPASQTGRMNRDGEPSTCAAAKPYPGTFATLTYRRFTSQVLYNNSSLAQCATIVVAPAADCDINAFAAVYLDGFDSANIAAGYLGDSGYSFGLPVGAPLVFAVNVPPRAAVVINVNDSNSPAQGSACRITLRSNELDFEPLNAVPAPALDGPALGLLGLAFGLLGLIALRRTSA